MGVGKVMAQASFKLEEELLREAQYYLRLERSNVTQFVIQKLEEFVQDYRIQHPERVPGGVRAQAKGV